jgi:homospermidine synthase
MIEKKRFSGKVLFLGYGAVAQCTLPLFLDHIEVPWENITVIDMKDYSRRISKTKTGIRFRRRTVTRSNLDAILTQFVGDNGLLVDLAWNIGAQEIIGWCHRHNTLYANTSVEAWDPYAETKVLDKTLYHRQMGLRKMIAHWPSDSPTAIVDHGANPGLISSFAKQGLSDIADKLLSNGELKEELKEKVAHYRSVGDFAHLAYALGVKVIHCSERDTQITRRPRRVGEFVNTWSIAGFHEEGTAPTELGWGTHELKLPPNAFQHPEGPKNQIALAQMGINTWHRSFVPDVGEVEGMIIRHGEAFGLSDFLTVRDQSGEPIYRPTVHYVYMPCHEALSSLAELRARGYEIQEFQRIMTRELTSGEDFVGAFIMGHKYNAWWTGSILDIKEARESVPSSNATTLQVAAGMIAALMWAIDNPRKGLCLPEALPHDYVLDVARKYLGELRSEPYDWTPLQNRKVFFPENPSCDIDKKDPWQFECFLDPN